MIRACLHFQPVWHKTDGTISTQWWISPKEISAPISQRTSGIGKAKGYPEHSFQPFLLCTAHSMPWILAYHLLWGLATLRCSACIFPRASFSCRRSPHYRVSMFPAQGKKSPQTSRRKMIATAWGFRDVLLQLFINWLYLKLPWGVGGRAWEERSFGRRPLLAWARNCSDLPGEQAC